MGPNMRKNDRVMIVKAERDMSYRTHPLFLTNCGFLGTACPFQYVPSIFRFPSLPSISSTRPEQV